MRSALIILLSAMPILADAEKQQKVPQKVSQKVTVAASIESASVLFGPGIIPDRSGDTPPPPFEVKLSGEVGVEGLPTGSSPRFRFWLITAGQEEQLKKAPPHAAGAKALAHTITGKREGGGILFAIHWAKGTVEEEDRLFVEVFSGRRRVATASSPIQAHYLPVSHPRNTEEKN